MHRVALTLLVAALAGAGAMACAHAAGSTTPATHYRWTDTAGVVHYSDTIPASALAGGYDIVDNRGLVVRHVGRQLTPSEKRAAAAAAARQARAKRDAEQQRLQDAQMLAAYPTDTALRASQEAQLKQIRTDIASVETNLRSQEDSLTQLLAHAADLEHHDKPVPPDLDKRIAAQRKTVNDERAALAARRTDLARTGAKFQAQLQHYRNLRAQFNDPADAPMR